MNRFSGRVRSSFGSNAHFSRPVSASSATSRLNGVVTYNTPSTYSGVVSNALRDGDSLPSLISPVRYVHATFSLPTLPR